MLNYQRYYGFITKSYLFFVKNLLLIIALIIVAFLYFGNVNKYSVPMGYAGLFTQMAEQIADENFQLPMETPFYGPGGIPFAYPPFGLYILAILIKLTGKYFIFLKFIPPILGVISFIPLYYFTLELSKSHIAAMSAVVITGGAPDLYVAHAWAAGITRAPAFIFVLTSFYFYLKSMRQPSKTSVGLAGLFLGLTCLSHLVYTLFGFIFIWWWAIFNKNNFPKIKNALLVSIIGVMIASLWLVPVILRHGAGIFFNVINSHSGGGMVTFSFNLKTLTLLFLQNIAPVRSQGWLFTVLVFMGIFFIIIKGNVSFLLFFFLITLVFPESGRFVYLLSGILAGMGLSAMATMFSNSSQNHLITIAVSVLLTLVLGFLSYKGYKELAKRSPRLYTETLELAEYVQENIPTNQKYLALVAKDEAEWMPFLFEREPVIGHWGSEWLGTFSEQTYFMSLFRGCLHNQDWSCVKRTFSIIDVNPSYVISCVGDRILYYEIQLDDAWENIYENDRYVVWKR